MFRIPFPVLSLLLAGCPQPTPAPTPPNPTDTQDTGTPGVDPWVGPTGPICELPRFCDEDGCAVIPGGPGQARPGYLLADGLRVYAQQGVVRWTGQGWAPDPHGRVHEQGFTIDGERWGILEDGSLSRGISTAPQLVEVDPPVVAATGSATDRVFAGREALDGTDWLRWDGTAWLEAGSTAFATEALDLGPGRTWAIGNPPSFPPGSPRLEHWDGTTWSIVEVEGSPRHLARDAQEVGWLSTTAGLFREADDSWELVYPEVLGPRFAFTTSGALWAADGRWELQRYEAEARVDLTATVQVDAEALIAEGEAVWIGANGGVRRVEEDGTVCGLTGGARDATDAVVTWSGQDTYWVGELSAAGWRAAPLAPGVSDTGVVRSAGVPTVWTYSHDSQASAILELHDGGWQTRHTLEAQEILGVVAHQGALWIRTRTPGDQQETASALSRLDEEGLERMNDFVSHERLAEHVITDSGVHWGLLRAIASTRLLRSDDGRNWELVPPQEPHSTGLAAAGGDLWIWGPTWLGRGDGTHWTSICPGDVRDVRHVVPDGTDTWVVTEHATVLHREGAELWEVGLEGRRALGLAPQDQLWTMNGNTLTLGPRDRTVGASACEPDDTGVP